LESFIPALVHGILLEVVDAIGSFIPSGGNRLFGNSFNSSYNLLAIGAVRESIAVGG
jgi:hypothetical protein